MHSSGSTTPALEAGKKVSEDRGREFVWMPGYARIFLTYVFVNPCYWMQCLPSAGSVILVPRYECLEMGGGILIDFLLFP